MRGKATKALSIVLTPVIAAGVGFIGFQSFEELSSEKEIETPYKNVSAQASPGLEWLENFVSHQPFTHPAGGDANKWSTTTANRTLVDDKVECTAPQPMPPYIVNTKAGTNNTTLITAAITQPGMAKSLIKEYSQRADDCNIELSQINNEEIKIGDNTTLLFYGDTVVSIVFNKNENIDDNDKNSVINETRETIIRTLEDSQCVNIITNTNDNTRNIYYTVNNDPQGLLITEEINTTVNIGNMPTLVDVETMSVNYPNLTKPEGPLPQGFPDVPEKMVAPSIPPLPEISNNSYTRNVTFEVPDVDGAGCGWEWSLSQKTPIYDVEGLKNTEEALKEDALREVNENASEYVNNYLLVITERVMKQGELVRWNRYVDDVNKVHEQWLELENKREEIRPLYEQFVLNHNNWETFEDRKRIAQELFDKKVEICKEQDKKYLEWVEDGSRTYAPPVCGEILPPEIISQERPAEPSFIAPGKVTIPDSWEKPGENLQEFIKNEENTANKEYQSFLENLKEQEENNREEWEEENKPTATSTTTTPTTTINPLTPSTTPTTTTREPVPNPIDDIIDLLQ